VDVYKYRPLSSDLGINIAQWALLGIHHLPNRKVFPHAVRRNRRIEGQIRRLSSRELIEIGLPESRNGSTAVRILVLLKPILPLPPQPIDHGVVQEEYWVVWSPGRSEVTVRRPRAVWAKATHITSQDQMCPSMGSIDTFKPGLETDEIAIEVIDHVSHIIVCHGAVDHPLRIGVCSRSEDRVPQREEGVVSANVMRGRVNPFLVFESSVEDLEVVVWIAPGAKPSFRGVVPDRPVVDVMRVYGPVPVRLGAFVTALVGESVLKHLDVGPVPREEKAGKMDDKIQVHVHVYKIIVVRTVGGNGSDEGDVGGDGSMQIWVMRQSSKTLYGINPFFLLVRRELSPFPSDLGIDARRILFGSRRRHGKDE